MEQSLQEKCLSYQELIALKECKNQYVYRTMFYHPKEYDKKRLFYHIFHRMIEAIQRKLSISEVKEQIEQEIRTGYKQEWFDFSIQYEKSIEKNIHYFTRMAQYLIEECMIQDSKIQQSVEVNFSYKDIWISKVMVFAQVVLKKGERTSIILLEEGMPLFSHKARNPKNHPSHSIALCCAYLAFEPIYGPDIQVETWHLKSKDDAEGQLIERFEEKLGKNIVGYSFRSREEAWSCLKEALHVEEERNCSKCRNKSICHFSCEIYTNLAKEITKKDKTVPQFTAIQEEVVSFEEGAMCCVAVPGSGKTFALVNRLVYLLKKGVTPSEILFVTFTKKAVGELKKRVMYLLGTGNEANIPDIFTFHAFGYHILRENPLLVGQRVKIADTMDRLLLIQKALVVCPVIKNMSYDGAYLEYGIIRRLDKLFEEIQTEGKDQFILRYEGKKDVEGILTVFYEYERLLKEEGFISFDMQISMVNELFQKYPFLVEKYAKRYRYIMVDEYQDVNQEQVEMIYFIAKKHGNIVVVGDDDQNIYAWRGGSHRFMLEFQNDFPTAKMIIMNDNFRSNTGILYAANSLICNNVERLDKKIIGHKDAKHKPMYYKQVTSSYIVKIIEYAIKSGYKPGEIAILARTNKRLGEVLDVLEGKVKVAPPKDYLREDTVFLILYDVLTLFYDGLQEDLSFYRFLVFCGVENILRHDKKISLYEDLAFQNKLPNFYEMEVEKSNSDISKAILLLQKIFQCIQSQKNLEIILKEIGQMLFGQAMHPVIEQLLGKAEKKAIVKIKDLYIMMKHILLFSDDSRIGYEAREDVVNLLTVHDAKGKEFSLVVVYAIEDFKDEPEEKRLLYVAMTRAKDTLFLLESVYNTCEVLPYFEENVTVYIGGKNLC